MWLIILTIFILTTFMGVVNGIGQSEDCICKFVDGIPCLIRVSQNSTFVEKFRSLLEFLYL